MSNKEVEQQKKDLQDRSERLERQFVEAQAEMQAKYGDPEKPENLGDISEEAGAAAFDKAVDSRVENVTKHLYSLSGWPQWMSPYSPEEVAQAIERLDRGAALTEALHFIIDWLSRAVEEVEEGQKHE